jgi:hypothetical protein
MGGHSSKELEHDSLFIKHGDYQILRETHDARFKTLKVIKTNKSHEEKFLVEHLADSEEIIHSIQMIKHLQNNHCNGILNIVGKKFSLFLPQLP